MDVEWHDGEPAPYRSEALAIMDALAKLVTRVDRIYEALFGNGDEEAQEEDDG